MSLNIYLDDCAYARDLVLQLTAGGHRVVTPADAGTTARSDDVHFQYAVAHQLVILTKNPKDFWMLHQSGGPHSGILAIYQDNDVTRDMSYAEIVKAIANLESSGVPIPGEFHVLNSWRY
ncbi:MAG TPA: DUF5615 family PIN-like protein [Gemmataceae bacterium]|nr:DUF5615 family PIN-like protein [Gemmataceae bacterium]